MELASENIKHKKHSEYKSSGAEWIGEIPKHWKIVRLGNILIPSSERNRIDLPLLSITREKGVILRNLDDEEENHNYIPDDLSNYKVLKRGQFGMNKMKAWQGSYGISPQDGIVSPAYFIFDLAKDINPDYFHIAIRSKLYVSYFGSASDGVRIGQWDLSRERMKNIPFLIPSLSEQTAIASFLDRKTAQIDKAISIKERQIDLLKERRQILIHHAVTRGLNPNVKMKDSGVEWIGEIPEHWEVKRLKNICEMLVSNVDKHSKPLELPVKLCNYVDVYKNDFINSGIEFMYATATIDEISRFKIKLNDVIITKDSEDWLDIGVPALVKFEEESLICGYHLAILRPVNNIFGAFLHRSLLSPYIKTQFSVKANGVTRYGISHGAILGTFIIVPPIEEQKEISVFIETGLERITTAVTCKIKEIEKLKEYKATLINSAVTGKIKVTQDA